MLRPDRVESSMPDQPCLKNIDLFCRGVRPHPKVGKIPEWGRNHPADADALPTTCRPFG
jgi:hypothetical protein